MKDSAIQWCDHTFNPWEGCTKVAPECKNCYAEILVDKRFGRAKWGKGNPRRKTSPAYWRQPRKWDAEAKKSGIRRRVFCCSLADVFDAEVDYSWRFELFELIEATGYLDWLLLTKRPQNIARMIAELATPMCELWDCHGDAPGNVWLGVSAGVDPTPMLEVPAEVHFLSCEPMLKPLDTNFLPTQEFDWIIFGGESGKNARPCNVQWIRDGVAFCRRNGIAPFVKQLGAKPFFDAETAPLAGPIDLELKDSHGGDMSEWPEDLRVREFPKVSAIDCGSQSKP